jgi:hypothetical protein
MSELRGVYNYIQGILVTQLRDAILKNAEICPHRIGLASLPHLMKAP